MVAFAARKKLTRVVATDTKSNNETLEIHTFLCILRLQVLKYARHHTLIGPQVPQAREVFLC